MAGIKKLDATRALRALNAAAVSQSAATSLRIHEAVGLIKLLQSSQVEQSEMLQLEWSYLPLLDEHSEAQPKTLEAALARDPEFFCHVVAQVFRSQKAERRTAEGESADRRIAENGYRLLSQWRMPPGTRTDGTLDSEQLNNWAAVVKAKTAESGHLDIAMEMIGHVLAYAPSDPDGLWIHRGAAAVLNGRDAGHIREGFAVEIFNQRGVHFVDPSGQQEKDLEAKYLRQANEVDQAGFPRFAASVRGIARSYELESRQVKSRHELDE